MGLLATAVLALDCLSMSASAWVAADPPGGDIYAGSFGPERSRGLNPFATCEKKDTRSASGSLEPGERADIAVWDADFCQRSERFP